LVLGEKVEVEAEPESLGEVRVRDDGVLVLHVYPKVRAEALGKEGVKILLNKL
jgi:hypothetical protein